MKKITIISLIMITIVIVCIPSINAQHSGNITIKADGSISSSTAPIQQTSTVYYLTSNFTGTITIHTSNIILDGNGHTVSSVLLQDASNVTVKNFVVTMKNEFTETIGILLNQSSNNLIINNTVTGFWSVQALNGIDFGGIYVINGNSNVITKNNVTDNLVGMDFINTSLNVITQNNITSNSPYTSLIHFVDGANNIVYHNNFISSAYQARVYNSTVFWDNGFPIGGNYWSDYQTKYPNASMIDNSGIGNTPYVIDAQNKDNYPLMEPYNASAIVEPSPTPSAGPTASGSNGNTAMDNTVLIGVVAAFVVVLAVAGLVVYFKRRRH